MKNSGKELKSSGIEEARRFEIFKSFMQDNNDTSRELFRELAKDFETPLKHKKIIIPF